MILSTLEFQQNQQGLFGVGRQKPGVRVRLEYNFDIKIRIVFRSNIEKHKKRKIFFY